MLLSYIIDRGNLKVNQEDLVQKSSRQSFSKNRISDT